MKKQQLQSLESYILSKFQQEEIVGGLYKIPLYISLLADTDTETITSAWAVDFET